MWRNVIECERRLCVSLGLALLLLSMVVATASAAPVITEYASGAGPQDGAAGPDGNTWFVESGANKIARVTPSGSMVEFSAGLSSSAGLAGIVAGPDGNLWFTEGARNAIGRITTAGVITEFSTGSSGDHKPSGITAGSDGRLWFTETTANRIGAITTAGVVTDTPRGSPEAATPPASRGTRWQPVVHRAHRGRTDRQDHDRRRRDGIPGIARDDRRPADGDHDRV